MALKTTTGSGILLLDKPTGMTSHDVVATVRRLVDKKIKVGHSGTLDPAASGLLLVAIGSATRLIQYTRGLPKTYEATVLLGATSTTDDNEGVISPISDQQPTLDDIQAAAKKFIGESVQRPPAYSAIKYKGKKLYEYARQGEAEAAIKEIGDRRLPITIYSIEINSYAYPELQMEITCSSGTYIRSIARDLGEALNTGGYLSALRRSAIGPFSVKQSVELAKLSTPPTLHDFLLPSKALVEHLPSITLPADNVAKYVQGRSVEIKREDLKHFSLATSPIATFSETGELVGIGTFDPITSLFSPKTVLT